MARAVVLLMERLGQAGLLSLSDWFDHSHLHMALLVDTVLSIWHAGVVEPSAALQTSCSKL